MTRIPQTQNQTTNQNITQSFHLSLNTFTKSFSLRDVFIRSQKQNFVQNKMRFPFFKNCNLFGKKNSDPSALESTTTFELPELPQDVLVENPAYQMLFQELPDFAAIETHHFNEAVEFVFDYVNDAFVFLENHAEPNFQTLVYLGNLETLLNDFTSLAYFYAGLTRTPENAAALKNIQAKSVAFQNQIAQSEPLYEILIKLKNDPEIYQTLTSVQKRILEKRILNTELGGLGLEGSNRDRFNKISEELVTASSKFEENLSNYTKALRLVITEPSELSGLPADFLKSASELYNKQYPDEASSTAQNGPWALDLSYTTYEKVMTFCTNRNTREKIHRVRNSQATSGEYNNLETILKILRLRDEKAKLLGFDSFADMRLTTLSFSSPEEVMALQNDFGFYAKQKADEEIKFLQSYAEKLGFEDTLQAWDILFYQNKFKEEKFGFDASLIQDYYSLTNVLDGMFDFYENLFSIKIEIGSPNTSVLNDDMLYYTVHDSQTGEKLGHFYYDPFKRSGKTRGARALAFRSGYVNNSGEKILPISLFLTNFEKPSEGKDASLSYQDIIITFHEFGHVLQNMLSTQVYQDVAGLNGIEADTKETASSILEYFLEDKELLLSMSSHKETGEPIPEELLDQLIASRKFMLGYQYATTLSLGKLDMKLHNGDFDPHSATPDDLIAFAQSVYSDNYSFPIYDNYIRLGSFRHLWSGSYSARYYTYLFSDVLAASYFKKFKTLLNDPQKLNELGLDLRYTLFSMGGSSHPFDVYQMFSGEEFDANELLRVNGFLSEQKDEE